MTKKTKTLSIRLADDDFEKMTGFAAEVGIPLAEMVRRLMTAANDCFVENDGWPREIIVAKKPRDGADIQPVATLAAPGTQNVRGETRSLSPTRANAAPKTATKRKPALIQK